MVTELSYSQSSKQELIISIHDAVEHRKIESREKLQFSDSTELTKIISDKLDYYNSLGFLSAQVDSTIKTETQLNLFVSLGPVFSWQNLSFSNFPEEDFRALNLEIDKQIDIPVSLADFTKRRNKIISYYENNGYPFASVKLDSSKVDGSKLIAVWELSRGPSIFIDSVHIKGDTNVHTHFIYRFTEIFPKRLYSEKHIKNISRVIEEIPFVEEIKPAEVEFFEE